VSVRKPSENTRVKVGMTFAIRKITFACVQLYQIILPVFQNESIWQKNQTLWVRQ